MQTKLKLDGVSIKRGNEVIFENLTWEIKEGENWIITGKSGSGKSSLLQALHGNYFICRGSIRNHYGPAMEHGIHELDKHASFVFFQDDEIDYNNYYYQQRYNSTEVEGTFTLHGFLLKGHTNRNAVAQLAEKMNIAALLDREFIKLSNGETRKALLVKALLRDPKLLVLDNPYTGLDTSARKMVNSTIDGLIEHGVQVIMVGDGADIPHQMTHVFNLDDLSQNSIRHRTDNQIKTSASHIPISFAPPENNSFKTAVKLTGVTVKYDKTILDRINWTIKKNEKWALTGPNGAGKSMLISLIFADNPQAYANEMILFDSPRGKGESIWDIKERIGFVSPEAHFYMDKQQTCREFALNGLYINPYKKINTANQSHLLNSLIRYFNIEKLTDNPLHRVSTSQQRLVLFISAILRNPALLLLDEPFQGFDPELVEKSKVLLDQFCIDRTLVFVSHKQEEIPSCVHRFATLEKGMIKIRDKAGTRL
jgi:molybdate transport system ATP-binding protein